MPQITSKIRFLKNELMPRYSSRIKRPIKVILGAGEFLKRGAYAREVRAEDCHDLEGMRAKGFSVLPSASLDLGPLCKAAGERLAAATDFQQRGTKTFFSQLLRKEDLGLGSPYMRLALDEKILRTAAAYLGCAAFLESVELLHSRPVSTLSRSQLWHKDRTDKSLFKIFLYCLDVTEENGPFSFLDAAESGHVPENLPHYLTDEEISGYVPLSKIVRITGPAKTIFLIDTSRCYHFGSRCVKPRLAYVAYYTSGFGYFPRETKWNFPAEETGGLSDLQRLAIGLST